MISQLEGTIVHKDLKSIILDVNGVGYKIAVSPETLEKVSASKAEKIRFWTHLAVRENALDLYGFLSSDELHFFEKLITVSGVGPKTAMGILSLATIGSLRSAIASGDPSRLTKTSGIGKKTAEKIVLELKDKIVASAEERQSVFGHDADVIEALESLGYSDRDAREVLKKMPEEITGTAAKVKQALKMLGSK